MEPVDPVPVADLGHVHLAGIGGAGMSGIARILLARGVKVSGCDAAPSDQLRQLAELGADVHIGHDPAHLGAADTVVVSTAIRADNAEITAARQRGLRMMHRAAALASVMLGRTGIAVAGTHGKTTTTSMITTVLRSCGTDPSYVIGGILAETGLGAADGTGDVFVAEADESDGSFLMLAPRLAVVTCIEADHLDNYADLAQIEGAFAAFAHKIIPGGTLIASADDPGAAALARSAAALPITVLSYGTTAAADYRVSQVSQNGMATSLSITGGGRTAAATAGRVEISIGVPGAHNAHNAAAAFAAVVELGVPTSQAAAGLAAYRGAQRRMQLTGEADGVRVLDSYAHHPTELRADLSAARQLAGDGRVVAVFQPHLFSRTRIFAAEFGAALALADEVLVLDVYAAREDPEPGVTGELISSAVPGGHARFEPDRAAVPAAVAQLTAPGDLVMTMGAGDVTALGKPIVTALAARRAQS